MFRPRFSIRSLLILPTASSFVCLVAMFAVQGSLWALAVTISLLGLSVSFVAYALVFAVAYLLASSVAMARASATSGTPFATQTPPPQIIPPNEPE